MYFRVKLKNELFHKGTVLLFLIGVLFSVILFYFQENARPFVEYSISIADFDKTESSKKLVEYMKKNYVYRENGEADILYEIRKGYEKKLSEGKLEHVIGVKKYPSLEVLKVMNDKIGSEVVKNFLYRDVFQRIKKEKKIDFTAYEESLLKTKKENEILSLNMISEIRMDKIEEVDYNGFVRYGKYVFLIVSLLIGGYLNFLSFDKLSLYRESGMKHRLKLAEIFEYNLILTEFIENHIKIFMYFLGMSLMFYPFKVEIGILIIFCLYLSFFLCYFIEKIVKKTLFYRIMASVVSGLLIGVGVIVLYLRF